VLEGCQKTAHALDKYDQTVADECFLWDDCTQDLATKGSLPAWPRLHLQICKHILHTNTPPNSLSKQLSIIIWYIIRFRCSIPVLGYWQASQGLWGSDGLKMPTNTHFFRLTLTITTGKVGRTDLVFACNQGSLVDLCKQDYKPLCIVVTICATVVNIQTYTHRHDRHTDSQYFDQFIWIAQSAELKTHFILALKHYDSACQWHCIYKLLSSTDTQTRSLTNH